MARIIVLSIDDINKSLSEIRKTGKFNSDCEYSRVPSVGELICIDVEGGGVKFKVMKVLHFQPKNKIYENVDAFVYVK